MEKQKNLAVVCLTAAFLLGFLVWSLLKPDDTVSQSERRKLAQKPELTARFCAERHVYDGFRILYARPVPAARRLPGGSRPLFCWICCAKRITTASILQTAMPPSWNTR